MTPVQSFVDRNPKVGLWTIFSSGVVGLFGLYTLGILGLPFDHMPLGSNALLPALVFFLLSALSAFGRPVHPHPFLFGAAAVIFPALTGAFGRFRTIDSFGLVTWLNRMETFVNTSPNPITAPEAASPSS
jgi:hypothetical protein